MIPINCFRTAGSDEAGPIVATILVRRGTIGMTLRLSATRPGKRRPAGLGRPVAELALDPQQLVVLRRPVRARRGARLDLAGAERDCEIGDRRVLGLAGAVG